MNKGLFMFRYIIYDGTNASEIAKKFKLSCEDVDGELIIDSGNEATAQKGDCLIRMADWICIISQDEFKKIFIGEIKG